MITWPLSSFTVTLTLLPPSPVAMTPERVPPFSTYPVLEGMSTFWPTRAEACNAWLEVIRLLRLSIWVERLLIPWEVDIEVIWDNIWALSTGLNGSW
ncbi:hypothetical protein D3C76_1689100 [compost metagenome]